MRVKAVCIRFRLQKRNNSENYIETASRTKMKSWQLPPNLYNVTKIPYEIKRGAGGAYWPKIHTHQSKNRPCIQQRQRNFYNSSENNRNGIHASCNRAKGYFLTNARERLPTARCMVNCLSTCYRNPSDPGPTTYSPVSIKKTFRKSLHEPSPHIFYYSSNVPESKNAIHKSHTSFTAAPGRYETRYPKLCPCSSRFIYQPQIKLRIDIEKRKKFRNLPYKKINERNYISPDWRHVQGGGFRYLFMVASSQQSKVLAEHNAKGQKPIKLYPDAKYIGMITNPLRTPLSFRSNPILSLQPRVRFNCTPKVVTRKHLRINKKTAFGSCQERFKDPFRMPVLTLAQREKLKRSLPLESQLRDRPIMSKRLSEINSKLNEIPKHMLANYTPSLRKKMFKFQPLPQAKVLLSENETSAQLISEEGFYLRSLETKNFFK